LKANSENASYIISARVSDCINLERFKYSFIKIIPAKDTNNLTS